MTQTKESKLAMITEFRVHEKDTGSPEVQIALLNDRMKYLSEHFRFHTKDHHSRRGLLKIVARRKKLLDYLKSKDIKRYKTLIERLGIRK
ncbi:MAG: 30S ribosomal protein S15 [Nitrospirae bacterium]|nr:30S ribosomal protein S15 [Nitrospirota bacterium]MBF0518840.1 30S ribosomal protein S15 [Nitrospirota bacterium]MBF0535486.1 30S ribosomal protein S15 [Nitrospirota bacterium]MBF0617382.1 30S ribosomal protein S15 [Nitrospirota bacterium]